MQGREKVGFAVDGADLVEGTVVGADSPVEDVAPDDLKEGVYRCVKECECCMM